MGERTILKLRREAEERLGKCEECLQDGERTILKLRREAEERLGKCEECLQDGGEDHTETETRSRRDIR